MATSKDCEGSVFVVLYSIGFQYKFSDSGASRPQNRYPAATSRHFTFCNFGRRSFSSPFIASCLSLHCAYFANSFIENRHTNCFQEESTSITAAAPVSPGFQCLLKLKEPGRTFAHHYFFLTLLLLKVPMASRNEDSVNHHHHHRRRGEKGWF